MWHVTARIILTQGGEEKGSLENRGTGGKSCVEVDGALPIHQALLRASHSSCCSPIGR